MIKLLNEYDVVCSKTTINEKVGENTKGVILMILDGSNDGVYEVEFFDNHDDTLDVTEVKGNSLRKSI